MDAIAKVRGAGALQQAVVALQQAVAVQQVVALLATRGRATVRGRWPPGQSVGAERRPGGAGMGQP